MAGFECIRLCHMTRVLYFNAIGQSILPCSMKSNLHNALGLLRLPN